MIFLIQPFAFDHTVELDQCLALAHALAALCLTRGTPRGCGNFCRIAPLSNSNMSMQLMDHRTASFFVRIVAGLLFVIENLFPQQPSFVCSSQSSVSVRIFYIPMYGSASTYSRY